MGNDNSIKRASIYIYFIAGILIFMPRTFPSYTNPWILLQWNVNYENGFIYRGLLGAIIQSFIGSVTSSEMMVIGAVFTVLYYISLCFFVYIIMKNVNNKASFFLILLFISQPFVTQWYLTSTMFGRLDVVLNILFFISVMLVIRLKPSIYLPIIIAVSILCMLIHEGYAVYSIPTLCAAVIISSINKNSIKSTAKILTIFLVPCTLAFVVIVCLGKPEMSQEAFYSYVSSNILEVKVTENDVYSIYYMPFVEKITYALNKFTLDKIIHLIATIVFIIPTIYVSIRLWKCILSNSNKVKKSAYIITIILSFSTITAYLIAVDTMRWLGYIVINNIVVLLVIYAIDKDLQDKISSKAQDLIYIIIFSCVLSIVLGPTQWMKSYEIVDKAYNAIACILAK